MTYREAAEAAERMAAEGIDAGEIARRLGMNEGDIGIAIRMLRQERRHQSARRPAGNRNRQPAGGRPKAAD